ncbi:gliding motility-associated C-terminal domain-containing protein [Mucilaginibacter terrenus]|uniref:Gliding motility-associated C-terminal domain-containing protein n=1 Tax=Mucilaginibacter terrenus TaxID=2482727 RepID=A0A3E2NQU1_9SPHI|nr:gliding motility-associated C-terminal domain-containing protein [Mucilaginibacter terrenus]RFZ83362.1 gliding motility-associated C-terminal domain-containing protein [Mucilaginibacter terrenus]
MHPSLSAKLILILLLLPWLQSRGQTCTGSLGDPVINETFGAGTTFGTYGPALPRNVTTYNFVSNTCPADGSYTIASGTANCFGATWEIVPHDHTGDRNGYMMIINASYDPGLFYTQTVKGDQLCPNTTYEFAAWIMNVMRDSPQTQGTIQPNITFIIETVDGRQLAPPYNTGNIPQLYSNPNFADGKFRQYGTFFTTPSDGADIVVKMINNAPGGNGNDLILDDITFRPCGPIIETGFGSVDASADLNFCEGSVGTQTFNLKSKQTGYNDPYYQWQVNKNDGKGWIDITGATANNADVTLSNPAAGKYQYRVGILDGPSKSLACRIYSKPLNIYVNLLPIVGIAPETKVCEGTALRLTATGGTTYSWTGPNGFTSTEQSPVVSYTPDNSMNGTYNVIVSTDKGCTRGGSTHVSVLPKVNPSISSSTIICYGATTQLLAGGGINYKWSPSTGLNRDDIPNPIASPTETTTYHVKIDNGACTDETQEVTVRVLKLPHADAGKDVAIQEGESVTLTGTITGDSIRYYWTPAGNIDNALSATPVVNPSDNTIYTLHVESLANCGEYTDDVFVRVYKKITIPNTFSPNGDGINDVWNINQLYTYPEAVVKIFNRSGTLLYQSNGYAKPWTGSYNGKQLPAGVYYYVIDLRNNTPLWSGWVMMVR